MIFLIRIEMNKGLHNSMITQVSLNHVDLMNNVQRLYYNALVRPSHLSRVVHLGTTCYLALGKGW